MEEDTEDVRKIDEILTRHKIELQEQENDEDVYDDVEFINYEEFSDQDENEDEYLLPDFEATDVLKFQSYDLSKMLKDKEKQIVVSCEDPELKSLLQLNRAKNIQLMQFYKKIKDLLVECQENIAAKQEQIKATRVRKRTFFRVWRLGYPYFKTADNFPSPRNADGVEKDKNRELFSYQMTPSRKWNQTDMNRLTKGVIFYYKQGKETELKRKIARLEILMKKEGCKDKLVELKEFNSMLAEFKNTSDDIALLPADCAKYVDWDRVANKFLRGKYADFECKNMWKLYKDPHVSKQGWSHEEQLKLIELAEKYNHQDWEAIASELGTSKSSLLVCAHYFSELTTPLKKKFTSEEDQFLLNMVEKYKTGSFIPWAKIAHHFVDKDRQQLYYRYRYNLCLRNKLSATQNKFTEAEDVLIMLLVDKFGRRFSMFEKYFPNRSPIQIKARYANNLRNPVKKGAFTVEEDLKIINHVQVHGESNWVALTSETNRYGAQLRQRYKVLQMYLLQNPDESVKDAPRKICSSVNYPSLIGGYRFEFLRAMADRYKHSKKIPTLDDINELLSTFNNKEKPAEKDDTSTPIDNLLIDFFVERKNKLTDMSTDETHSCARQVQNLLDIFRATLEIPHNYYDTPNLDEFDKKILDIISSKGLNIRDKWVIPSKVLPESDLGDLVPPNVENLTGLRKLVKETLNFSKVDKCLPKKNFDTTIVESLNETLNNYSQEVKTNKIKWCIDNYLKNLDKKTKENIISDRATFNLRFVSLFKYPMLLDMFQPNAAISKEEKIEHAIKVYTRKKPTNRIETQNIIEIQESIEAETDQSSKVETEDATPNVRCYIRKKKPPEENADSIKHEIVDPLQAVEKTFGERIPKVEMDEVTTERHVVWITTPNKLFDMENACAPSTSYNNPIDADYPNLTMAEKLKLKIQHQLMDLDRSKIDKMPMNKNWVFKQCTTKSSDNANLLSPDMPFFAGGLGRYNNIKRSYRSKNTLSNAHKNPPTGVVPIDVEDNLKPLDVEKSETEKKQSKKRKKKTEIKSTTELDKNDIKSQTETKNKSDKNHKVLDSSKKMPDIKIFPTKKTKIEDNKNKEISNKARKQAKNKKVQRYQEDSTSSEDDICLLDRMKQKTTKSLKTYPTKNQTQMLKIKEENPPENIEQNEENTNTNSITNKKRKPKEKCQSSNAKVPKIKEEVLEENEHATFNLQKGELIIESDENSDLEDLKALNQALKKVKKEIDESPTKMEFENEHNNAGGHKIWVTTPNKLFGTEDHCAPSTSFNNPKQLSTVEKLKFKIINEMQDLDKNKKDILPMNKNWVFNKDNNKSCARKTKNVNKDVTINENVSTQVKDKLVPSKVKKHLTQKKRITKKLKSTEIK